MENFLGQPDIWNSTSLLHIAFNRIITNVLTLTCFLVAQVNCARCMGTALMYVNYVLCITSVSRAYGVSF